MCDTPDVVFVQVTKTHCASTTIERMNLDMFLVCDCLCDCVCAIVSLSLSLYFVREIGFMLIHCTHTTHTVSCWFYMPAMLFKNTLSNERWWDGKRRKWRCACTCVLVNGLSWASSHTHSHTVIQHTHTHIICVSFGRLWFCVHSILNIEIETNTHKHFYEFNR